MVPAYTLRVCLVALLAAAGFAASIELGFSADGAYVFARILEDRTFLNPVWSRLYADVALQWPLVLAVNAGVTSRPVLVGLFHLGRSIRANTCRYRRVLPTTRRSPRPARRPGGVIDPQRPGDD